VGRAIKNIMFVERERNVDEAVCHCEREDNNLIVALNSMVMWRLEKRGVPYKIPYDYYDMDELFYLKEDLYERTEQVCDYIDRRIFEFIPFFEEKQLKPAHALFHPIKCTLNALCQELLNIVRVLQSENPERVMVFEPPPERPNIILNLDPVRTNTYSKLISAALEKYNISEIIVEDKGSKEFSQSGIYEKIRNASQRVYDFLKSLPPVIKVVRGQACESIRNSKFDKELNINYFPRVLVFKSTYSVDMMAEYIKARQAGKIVEFEKFRFHHKKKFRLELGDGVDKLWRSLERDADFNRLFTFEEINLIPTISKYLHYLLSRGLFEVADIYEKTNSILENESVDIFLLPTVTYPRDWASAMSCKNNGVAVVTWQHGSYGMFDPHTQPIYYDIRNADFFFVFGEGVKNAYLEEGKSWNTEIIPIGCCRLDQIHIEKNDRTNIHKKDGPCVKTILVPLRGLNIPIIGDSYQTYPLDVYWRELTKVLELFSKFPQIRFVLKLYPANTLKDNPLLDFLKTKGIENVVVKRRPRFAKLLSIADLIIIDWPYSTLLEATKTSIPIICYKKFWRLRPGVEDLIKKRCFITDSIQDLESLLESYLHNELPVLNDEELLCEYGVLYNDGNTIHRAVRFLAEIGSRERLNTQKSGSPV